MEDLSFLFVSHCNSSFRLWIGAEKKGGDFTAITYHVMASAAAVKNHSQSLGVLMPEFRFYY